MKDKTTISLERETANKLKIFKIETNAPGLDAVIGYLWDKAKISFQDKEVIDWEALNRKVDNEIEREVVNGTN